MCFSETGYQHPFGRQRVSQAAERRDFVQGKNSGYGRPLEAWLHLFLPAFLPIFDRHCPRRLDRFIGKRLAAPLNARSRQFHPAFQDTSFSGRHTGFLPQMAILLIQMGTTPSHGHASNRENIHFACHYTIFSVRIESAGTFCRVASPAGGGASVRPVITDRPLPLPAAVPLPARRDRAVGAPVPRRETGR